MVKKIILLILLSSLIISCSKADKEAPRTKVNIKFDIPSKFTSAKWIKGDFDPNAPQKAWGQSAPTTFAGFNCFGVFINYPEFPPSDTCKKSDGSQIFQYFDQEGLFSSGTSVTTEVFNGQNREFYLVGFYSTVSCPSLNSDIESNESNMSPPVLLGTRIQNISPSENNVEIVANISTSEEFDTCSEGGTGSVIDPCNSGELSSSCNLWLDASDLAHLYQTSDCSTTAVTTSGESVQCWKNKSLSGGAYADPINASSTASYDDVSNGGYPGISFTGSSTDTLTIPTFVITQEPTTIFVVFKSSSTSAMGLLSHQGTNTNVDMFLSAGLPYLTTTYTGIIASTSTNYVNTNNRTIAILKTDGAGTVNIYSELAGYFGTLEIASNSGAAQTITTAPLNIGDSASGSQYFDGYMFEIIWYNTELSDADKGKVINYLKNKWGI